MRAQDLGHTIRYVCERLDTTLNPPQSVPLDLSADGPFGLLLEAAFVFRGVSSPLRFSMTPTVTDAVNGVLEWTNELPTDFPQPGRYRMQPQLVFTDGQEFALQIVEINVGERL